MSVELLQTLSTVFFILAAVFFLIALALFFVLDVVHLVGDVTGSTARKAIEDIRKGNEISGDKAYKPSPVNKARGKLTDKISPSGQLVQRTAGLGVATGTAKLSTDELNPQSDETSVLDVVGNETTVLSADANETTLLSGVSNETTVLNNTYGETAVLSDFIESAYQDSYVNANNNFVVDLEMSFIGSSELIE